uniref:Hg-scorpine-like-2 n=1 Tax=Hoffmannihadrurus gertschi TaxID=380989 RepID=KBX32_HOFGE|nr:RecName: Full=Hg-scorpine-like-2; Short=HgeScplp2; Short=Hgscplike2; Flags: Precursor [Hadrurus gertschi]
MKLTILILLVITSFCSCGILREKYAHKAIDVLTPMIGVPVVSKIVNNAAKQLVHKIAKNQQLCMFNKDVAGWCEKSCQQSAHQKGYCHGTKCKCGIPLNYK